MSINHLSLDSKAAKVAASQVIADHSPIGTDFATTPPLTELNSTLLQVSNLHLTPDPQHSAQTSDLQSGSTV